MKAMILAAGLGTRLKPFTDKHPKALALVNGKSLLQRNVEYLASYGIKDILVNVHHFADQIEEAIKKNNGWGSDISISDERGEILETGGGLKKAANFFENDPFPFLLMNVDILTNLDLDAFIQAHEKIDGLATLATTNRSTSRYLLFDDDHKLCGWLNEKTGEEKGKHGHKRAFSGMHIIRPQIFPLIKETGKFSMIDLYLRLCKHHPIYSFDHSDGLLQDVGNPESLQKAETLFP